MESHSNLDGQEQARVPTARAFGMHEGFATMIGKLIDMALSLSECVAAADNRYMSRCQKLREEVRFHQKSLTRDLLASPEEKDFLKVVIHLPFRLETIGERLECILNCFRIRGSSEMRFNDDSEAAFQQLLAILIDMMNNLRDAFALPDAILVESIIAEGDELRRLLGILRSSHWSERDTPPLTVQTNVMCLDILDSIKSANEDIAAICKNLLDLGRRSQQA